MKKTPLTYSSSRCLCCLLKLLMRKILLSPRGKRTTRALRTITRSRCLPTGEDTIIPWIGGTATPSRPYPAAGLWMCLFSAQCLPGQDKIQRRDTITEICQGVTRLAGQNEHKIQRRLRLPAIPGLLIRNK